MVVLCRQKCGKCGEQCGTCRGISQHSSRCISNDVSSTTTVASHQTDLIFWWNNGRGKLSLLSGSDWMILQLFIMQTA